MAKIDQYFSEAEDLYVVKQLTVLEVAEALPISEQTVRNWSKKGKWQEKREELLSTKDKLDKELYETARVISKKIREDLEADKDVAPGRFYALARILEVIEKVRKYEKVKDKDPNPNDEGNGLDFIIKKIDEHLTGA